MQTNQAVQDISTGLLNSTNLIGVPPALIASTTFNAHPVALQIAGVHESAQGLFTALNQLDDAQACGALFQDYMLDRFGDSAVPQKAIQRAKKRYRNSYLRLIQDWGMDANNAQAAVLKGWVESRFGLCPTYHKQPLTSFFDHAWMQYLEDKMHSRYHNNCIYMQLDLLFTFCQWFMQRFQSPTQPWITLFRGVNAIEKQCVADLIHKNQKIVRFNNLTSFTVRASTASEFGDTILKVDVPVVKLLFFNQLLPHHALHGESEYLVIGGDYLVTLV